MGSDPDRYRGPGASGRARDGHPPRGADAVQTLPAPGNGVREHEMRWLRPVPLATLDEVEELAHRLVALRHWGVTGGAQRLRISHVALSRWVHRRRIPT